MIIKIKKLSFCEELVDLKVRGVKKSKILVYYITILYDTNNLLFILKFMKKEEVKKQNEQT